MDGSGSGSRKYILKNILNQSIGQKGTNPGKFQSCAKLLSFQLDLCSLEVRYIYALTIILYIS
jgi:hypothetical protein